MSTVDLYIEEQHRKNNSDFRKTGKKLLRKGENRKDQIEAKVREQGVEEFEITRELLYETYNQDGQLSNLPTDKTMNVGKLINYMLDNYYDLTFSQKAHMQQNKRVPKLTSHIDESQFGDYEKFYSKVVSAYEARIKDSYNEHSNKSNLILDVMFWVGDYSEFQIMHQMQQFMLTNLETADEGELFDRTMKQIFAGMTPR